MEWTIDQKKVITSRSDNVLVSASAGSGKTAVLVARIMAYILQDKVDIDDLLIVTFTRAAAGEMRERIAKAIAAALEEDPDNEHLMRQTTLIHNAQITTIDGFCSYILRSYCHLTDLEPGYRVGDSGELDLLREDVMTDLLMELHDMEAGEKRDAFYALVETFAPDKNEDSLEEIIDKVFSAAQCQPDPSAWLLMCEEGNRAENFEELSKSAWMREYMRDADLIIDEMLELAGENLALANEPDGPSSYLKAAESDLAMCSNLSSRKTYGDRYDACATAAFARLSGRAKKEENADKREKFKAVRAEIKARMDKMIRPMYAYREEEILSAMQANEAVLNTLLHVAALFTDRFDSAKREKKLIDFPDLEHFALKILRNPDGSRTQAARELAGRFREVMCDEYQDSNLLQEAILTAVSRIEDGVNNYFCVGDVKQSIYSFRNARPDLFMDKFARYTHPDGAPGIAEGQPLSTAVSGTRIDLSLNFRSRHEVLDAANGIFRQIMMREVGRVEYDEEAFLVPRAAYPDTGDDSCVTEILTINMGETDTEGNTVLDETGSAARRDAEARLIAARIKHLVEHGRIYDLKAGCTRRVEYRDIVILLRTMKGWADEIASVLENMGIPSYSTLKTGYFEATEVTTVLNYLKIVDNPEQDVAFSAVLRSPIVGLGADDMARIRLISGSPRTKEGKNLSMAECTRRYVAAEDVPDRELQRRLETFMEFHESIREAVPYTPLHELIWMILTGTGYMNYVSALPGGTQRVANLRLLIDKSIDYEQTSYVGLFNFIRYINRMIKKQIEISGVNVVGENDNVVRIVSIHKSKGLEYPIVFVAGCDKKFNKSDLLSKVLIDDQLGIGADYTDLSTRTRMTTMKKMAIKQRRLRDSMGEELRVLYVAMTRAQQKLILVGAVSNADKYDDMRTLTMPLDDVHLPENLVLRAGASQELILPAADRLIARCERYGQSCPIRMELISPRDLVGSEIVEQTRLKETIRTLRNIDGREVWDPETRRIIEERYSYSYPYASHALVPAKVSVSELKHGAYADEEAEEIFPEPEIVPFIPEFMRTRIKESDSEEKAESPYEPFGGAFRGTAYHKVMELLRYEALYAFDGTTVRLKCENEKDLMQSIHTMCREFVSEGRLMADELKTIRMRDIARFAESSLGHRMAAAVFRGELYREQPFVLGVPASDIKREFPADELILVQGIIDAFFYEDGRLILVDYKTDRVETEKELVERYQIQLDSYEEALSRVTGVEVRQKLIYSFCLNTEIALS